MHLKRIGRDSSSTTGTLTRAHATQSRGGCSFWVAWACDSMPVASASAREPLQRFACAILLIFASALSARAADAPLRSGIDRTNFDTSIRPGDDFYQYVNGNWIKNNPIPPENSRWGAFPKLRDDNLQALHQIVEELAHTSAPLDDDSRKVRDLYLTAMDEAKLK